MPCYCRVFLPKSIVLHFHSICIIWSWSLLCEFNSKYLPFLCLCYQSLCALLLTGRICDRDVIIVCILYIFLELETMQISSYINCRDFAMIFAIFTKVCRVFYHLWPWFSTVPSYNGPLTLTLMLTLVHSSVAHQSNASLSVTDYSHTCIKTQICRTAKYNQWLVWTQINATTSGLRQETTNSLNR